MQTISVTTYTFDELSEDAKEIAIQDRRERMYKHYEFIWHHEYLDSLRAFDKVFKVKYGFDTYDDFDSVPDAVRNMFGIRLYKYLVNHYDHILWEPKVYHNKTTKKTRISRIFSVETSYDLTGMCYDEILLDPIRNYVKNPSKYKHYSFEDLIIECWYTWKKHYEMDEDYQFSNDAIAEDLIANQDQFTADGKIFNF